MLAYNRAVLSYQLRNYEQVQMDPCVWVCCTSVNPPICVCVCVQARSILEDLFKRIEPVDDFLAVKICLLLMVHHPSIHPSAHTHTYTDTDTRLCAFV